MPKILVVSSEFPPGPGGIGQHAYQLASGLAKLGWEVRVLSRQDYATEQEIEAWVRDLPFPVERLESRSSPIHRVVGDSRRLRQMKQDFQPDLIVATGRSAVLLASNLSPRLCPVVAIGHGTEFSQGESFTRLLTRQAFTGVTGTICVSQHTHRVMSTEGMASPSTTVIHNGADGSKFGPVEKDNRNQTRKRFNLPDGPLLLTVGNVTPRKGQDLVVRALPQILEHHPEVTYAVAGLLSNADELVDLSTALNVAPQVRPLGKVADQDLADLYRCADLFVLTSRNFHGDFEGFGIVVLEAALCGLPAVVSNSGGLPEAVADSDTGLVVEENDHGAIAAAVTQLLDDPDQLRAMGEAARQRAESTTWKHQIALYNRWLTDLIAA